jgi:hypothetical protein
VQVALRVSSRTLADVPVLDEHHDFAHPVEGDTDRGWVWCDGAHSGVKDWQVETELADDGLTHRISHVRATDKLDRIHELRADLLRVAPALHDRDGRRTVVNEGLARWSYDRLTGHGISEYLHQLDDAGRPVVPIE